MIDQEKLKEFKEKYYSTDNINDRLDIAKKYAEKPKMVPVTKSLSNGYSVTYYVGQTDVSVGNFPLSLDPHTAEDLAKKWNCWLPTGKVVSQIHSVARQQQTSVSPELLSASGYKDPITGEYHSAEDVVSDVGKHSAILEYANRVEDQLSKINPGENKVTVTNGKIIISPTDESLVTEDSARVFFTGIPVKVKKNEKGEIEVDFAQQGIGASPHVTSKKSPYMEYCTFIRLIDNKVDVARPDGSQYSTTYPEALRNPNTYEAFSNKPIKKIVTYVPREEQQVTATPVAKIEQPTDTKKEKTLSEKAVEVAEKAGKWVGEKAEKASKWLEGVFSSANEFEMLAKYSLQKTQLQKFAQKRKMFDKN